MAKGSGLMCWYAGTVNHSACQAMQFGSKGKKDETVWKKATEFRVVKLERRGPKEGQSVDQYLHGKTLGHNTAVAKYRRQQSMKGKL